MHDIFWYGYDNTQSIDSIFISAQSTTKTEYFWVLHKSVDYNGFDLNFVPDRYQRDMKHAWPAHNNPEAYTTWLVPRDKSFGETVFHKEMLPSHAPPIGKDLKGFHWDIDERIDYSDFDFDWFPGIWEWGMDHEFCLRGKDTLSYTTLSFKPHWTFDKKYHSSNLVLKDHYEIVELEMVDGRMARNGARKQRYVGNMMAALRTAIRKARKEWLWVTSDIVIYEDFDFEWLPDGDQRHQIHCWPSGSCEKGETFLIHVPSYKNDEEFVFNFDHEPLRRMDWPTQPYGVDSLAQAIHIHGTKALYTAFEHTSSYSISQPYPCLWEKRPVIAMNKSGSCSLVPRDCLVAKEIYEYPYLERQETLATDPRMDVIFISNGERQAAYNSVRLSHVMNRIDGPYFPAKHVQDCQGRLNSYQAAARLSSTDWFVAVFAKCYVTEELAELQKKWTPDYWQEPKHYIFHNHNMDNGLVYGHMAPIAYNRNLIFDNPGGLDITLAQPHTTVPIVLSQTSLDNDDWTNWRTAFRETVKLLHYNKTNPTVDSDYRLWVWLNRGSLVAIAGAHHGKEYYERCGGEESWLLMTVEWEWLKKYYDSLHRLSDAPDHP